MVRISYILNRKVSQEYKQQISSGEEVKEKEVFTKIGFYYDLPLFKKIVKIILRILFLKHWLKMSLVKLEKKLEVILF